MGNKLNDINILKAQNEKELNTNQKYQLAKYYYEIFFDAQIDEVIKDIKNNEFECEIVANNFEEITYFIEVDDSYRVHVYDGLGGDNGLDALCDTYDTFETNDLQEMITYLNTIKYKQEIIEEEKKINKGDNLCQI